MRYQEAINRSRDRTVQHLLETHVKDGVFQMGKTERSFARELPRFRRTFVLRPTVYCSCLLANVYLDKESRYHQQDHILESAVKGLDYFWAAQDEDGGFGHGEDSNAPRFYLPAAIATGIALRRTAAVDGVERRQECSRKALGYIRRAVSGHI